MPRIRGSRDLQSLPSRSRGTYARAVEALALARAENLTVKTAASRVGVSPASIRKYASDAVERDAFGRLVPKKADRLYRRIRALTPEGPRVVEVRGSHAASRIGEHWSRVGHYLSTGDTDLIRNFRGTSVGGVALAAEPDVIEELARQGEVSFEDLYEFAS